MPGKETTRKPPAAAGGSAAEARAMAFAIEAARHLSDDKCVDVLVLDVRALSQVTDFIVIGTGTSDRQMRSSLKNVEEFGEASGNPVFRSSTDDRATWLLADFVDVIVHVFEPNARAHYDLEMLWGDAPRLEWQRPSPKR
ncbi:MAG: ribosome silencing factor [Phycisphaeraceae bacterium]|nr:ribosome silencing factor [Phycisphaeraceae bacterium]